MSGLTFGSLFAGIGGLDLGLERAGWECRWQVEIDLVCQRILAKHWPDVRRYGDVRAFPEPGTERVDLICGGFPCQPVAARGKRLAQADKRWLWPEFARIIRLLRPRYALVENVPNLLAVNGGTAFGDVLGDLAACGFDAEWDCIPAAALGALHIRDRVFILAYPAGYGLDGWLPSEREREHDAMGRREQPRRGKRLGRREQQPESGAAARDFSDPRYRRVFDRPRAERWPAEQWASEWRKPGGPDWWAVEPDVGRVAHGVPARVDRLRGLGNAVVPQVAEWIGRRLREVALTCPPPR